MTISSYGANMALYGSVLTPRESAALSSRRHAREMAEHRAAIRTIGSAIEAVRAADDAVNQADAAIEKARTR